VFHNHTHTHSGLETSAAKTQEWRISYSQSLIMLNNV